MIIDAENISDTSYKVIICGSGPAGIAVALDLEKKKISSLIIEAGNETYSEKAQSRYSGKMIGRTSNDYLSESRLSQFGGTTGHWGGTCRTLDEYDFLQWPIKKKDLNIYLDEACKFLDIKNAFGEKKLNKNLKIIEFQESNLRIYDKYFNYVKKSKYINLALNTSIYNVKFENDSVVEVIIKSKKTYSIKNKLLVLACGGIENSRLLLWFRHLNPKKFKNLPIGKYWMGHPFKLIGTGVADNTEIKKNFKNDFHYFENYMNVGKFTVNISPSYEFIKNKKISNAGFFLTINERNNDNFKDILKNLLCVAPKLSNLILNKTLNKNLSCGLSIFSSWEQDPVYNNSLFLLDNRDDLGIPRIGLKYNISDKAILTIREIIEELGHVFIKKEIGRLAGFDFLYDKSKFTSDIGGHHLGGTIMGNDSNNSVVDKNLKVHNIKNLFVAGSSVFPTGGHANPTLTIVQLSLKLSNFLSKMI